MCVRAFRGRAPHVKLSVARTLDQARHLLQAVPRPAAVIADWQLPHGDGLELLSEPASPRLPVVVMTSHGNEREAVEAIKAGALDYVVKTDASQADLPHTIERALRQQHLQETLDQIMAGLTETGQAFFDSLALRLASGGPRQGGLRQRDQLSQGRQRPDARLLRGRPAGRQLDGRRRPHPAGLDRKDEP